MGVAVVVVPVGAGTMGIDVAVGVTVVSRVVAAGTGRELVVATGLFDEDAALLEVAGAAPPVTVPGFAHSAANHCEPAA